MPLNRRDTQTSGSCPTALPVRSGAQCFALGDPRCDCPGPAAMCKSARDDTRLNQLVKPSTIRPTSSTIGCVLAQDGVQADHSLVSSHTKRTRAAQLESSTSLPSSHRHHGAVFPRSQGSDPSSSLMVCWEVVETEHRRCQHSRDRRCRVVRGRFQIKMQTLCALRLAFWRFAWELFGCVGYVLSLS